VTQKPPAQLVAVPAVSWIGEESLLKVVPQHFEKVVLARDLKIGECILLQAGYQGVLLIGLAVGKARLITSTGGAIQCRQTKPVGLDLVPVRTCQGLVYVGEDADLDRTWTVMVGRKEAFEDRRGRPRLTGV
jgi:hypothetical protein